MGQKIRPNVFRLGITQYWDSRWFGINSFPQMLQEDETIRAMIQEKIGLAGIARCEIERTANTCRVYIKAAKPGLVIGRGGQGIEQLSKSIEASLAALYKKHRWTTRKIALSVNVEELKRTSIAAATSAQNIAWDLEKRLPFRRTMKKALENMMQNREIQGAKVRLSGRLDGNEIARREWLAKGKLPLQTLRADIDYAHATAFTTYGTIGIKVWLYRGDIFDNAAASAAAKRQ